MTSYVIVYVMVQALCGNVFVSSENQTVPCGSGFILSSNLSFCQPCPHDTYQPLDQPTSNTVCINCTSGNGTVNVASNSSTDCTLFCQPGSGYNGSSVRCQNCSQGFWNNGNSSMRFKPCQKCPVNYTTEGIGATDVNNCTLRLCGPGQYVNDSNDCNFCAKGYYSSSPHSRSCTACSPLETTNQSGSTSESDCNGLCHFGERECNNKGVCEVNQATKKYECRCRDLYTGPYCNEFSEFYGNFIGYLCGGFGAALVIVILIALYIKCYRPREQKKKRKMELQENNNVVPTQPHDYIDLPLDNPYAAITEADNTNIDNLSRRNPLFSQYDILYKPDEVYEEVYEELPPDQSTQDYTIYKPYDTLHVSNLYTISGQPEVTTSQVPIKQDLFPIQTGPNEGIAPSHEQWKHDLSPGQSTENASAPELPPLRHNVTPRGSTLSNSYLQVL